jgi:FtsH-binding integral membrane protein
MNSNFGNSWAGNSAAGTLTGAAANALLQKVFTIMAIGLALTGVTAYGFSGYLAENLQILMGPARWLLMLAPFAFVMVLSFGINRMSYMTATLVFGLYAVTMGLSLSFIFLIYTATSIATTFFITAGMFGAMVLYGITTKADLTKLGSIMMMALFGIIIASIVNWFVGSPLMSYIISIVTVVVFAGLTAYDTQKILAMGQVVDADSETGGKVAIIGALELYLDFINMFLALLRLFGDRK